MVPATTVRAAREMDMHSETLLLVADLVSLNIVCVCWDAVVQERVTRCPLGRTPV